MTSKLETMKHHSRLCTMMDHIKELEVKIEEMAFSAYDLIDQEAPILDWNMDGIPLEDIKLNTSYYVPYHKDDLSNVFVEELTTGDTIGDDLYTSCCTEYVYLVSGDTAGYSECSFSVQPIIDGPVFEVVKHV